MSESVEPFILWSNAETAAESQAILQAHPELLSDESYSQIESSAVMAVTARPDLVPTYFCLAALAGAARRDGIEAAYARIDELMTGAHELAGYREQLEGVPEPSQIPALERALHLSDQTGLTKPLRIRGRLAYACLNKLDYERAVSLYRDCIERDEGITAEDTLELKYFLAAALSGLASRLDRSEGMAARAESVKWLLESGAPPRITSLLRSVILVAHLHFLERDWKRAEHLYSMALERFENIYSTYTPMSRETAADLVAGLPACLAYSSIRDRRGDDCEFRASHALERGRLRAQSLVHHREELLLATVGILPMDLHEQLQQASIRLGKAERGGLITYTLQSVQRAAGSKEESDAIWNQQLEDVDRFKEQVEAAKHYERLCNEIEQLYPGTLKSCSLREMPEAGELLEEAEGLAYLAHTDFGAVAILWIRNGVKGDVVAHAWVDEELNTAVVEDCLSRPVKTFWKWKQKGLLPAQSGKGSLAGEVNAAIRALDKPHSVLSKMARACRTSGLRRLVLVPCGFFSLLPLHAAPVYPNEGEPGMPLTDVVQISHSHSVATWVLSRMRARHSAKRPPYALVVSDPKPAPVNFPPLPNAKEEAKFVAQLVDRIEGGRSVTLRDEAATCSSVVTAVNQSQPPITHIHFACHAAADVQQPKQSGLILSDGEVLTVFDLADPGRSAVATLRLAVLAACQTAVVGTDLIDEALGLSAAWIQFGAATVVGSLWPISDKATLAIMKKFYELHLIDGLPPSDSLWLAQRWLRGVPGWRKDFEEAGAVYSAGQPDAQQERRHSTSWWARHWDHPVYWAAFVVYGD